MREVKNLKIRDIMIKNPITVSTEDTVGHTLNIFEQSQIRPIPILNKEKIAGVITKEDIYTKRTNRQEKISDIMLKNPLTVSPDEELIIALNIIKSTKIPSIIVAEDTKFVGILTINDIYNKYKHNNR